MSCQFDENGAFLRQQNIVPFYCKYRISGKLSCISEAMRGKKMSKIVHSKCDCDLNLNCALDYVLNFSSAQEYFEKRR